MNMRVQQEKDNFNEHTNFLVELKKLVSVFIKIIFFC